MDWMLMPLRRYADFQGRSRRMEYWMFVLFTVLICLVPWILMAVLGGYSSHPSPLALIPALLLLVVALALIRTSRAGHQAPEGRVLQQFREALVGIIDSFFHPTLERAIAVGDRLENRLSGEPGSSSGQCF